MKSKISIAALALLAAFALATPAQAQFRSEPKVPNLKIGMSRATMSGATYTLKNTTTSTEYSASSALEGNDLFLEYILFGRFGVEADLSFTPMHRAADLANGGTTLATLNEDAKMVMIGANFYFFDHMRKGVKPYFGVATGTAAVSHTYEGTLATTTSKTVPVNYLRFGVDWILDQAGIRFQYNYMTGQSTDSVAIPGYKQTFGFSGSNLGIGVFAFF